MVLPHQTQPATHEHIFFFSVYFQPSSSPCSPNSQKELLSVQSSSLIALTHFPLYFISRGLSPVGSSCFGNGFLPGHPHVHGFAWTLRPSPSHLPATYTSLHQSTPPSLRHVLSRASIWGGRICCNMYFSLQGILQSQKM